MVALASWGPPVEPDLELVEGRNGQLEGETDAGGMVALVLQPGTWLGLLLVLVLLVGSKPGAGSGAGLEGWLCEHQHRPLGTLVVLA